MKDRGSRWAPIVVFGGILVIGLSGVTAVAIQHCQREEPYNDAELIPYDPENVKPIPEPIRQRPKPE